MHDPPIKSHKPKAKGKRWYMVSISNEYLDCTGRGKVKEAEVECMRKSKWKFIHVDARAYFPGCQIIECFSLTRESRAVNFAIALVLARLLC